MEAIRANAAKAAWLILNDRRKMNVFNVDQFLDGLAGAGIGTWVSAFLGVAALFALGFYLAVRFAPKKELTEDSGAQSAKKKPTQPPETTRGK